MSRATVVLTVAGSLLATALAGAGVEAPRAGSGVERIAVVAGGGGVGDGGPATGVVLAGIGGMVVDRAGNLYFSDIGRNRVRRVDAETGELTTVAGTGGVETSATAGGAGEFDLFTPGGLALDGSEKVLYVGEVAGKRVLKIDLAHRSVEDLGAPPLGFGQPVGLTWTPADGLLVVDTLEGQVWRHDEEGWVGTFQDPGAFPGGIRNVVRDAQGNLYLTEFFSHRLLRWDRKTGEVTTVAGELGNPGLSPDGTPAAASLLRTPDGLAIDGAGNLYFSDMNNQRIARIDAATGTLSTFLSYVPGSGVPPWTPGALVLDRQGRFWVADVYSNRILRFAPGSNDPKLVVGGGGVGDGGPATAAVLAHPGCLALDDAGNLYIADALNHRVRKVSAADGTISTVAGTGVPGYNGDGIPAVRAQVNYPGGLLVDGHRLYIGDYYSNRVRQVDLTTGIITTLAGSGAPGLEGDGGPAVKASMLNPHALTLDPDGGLIVTSAVSQSVRRIDLATGTIDAVRLDPRMVPPTRVLVFYDVAYYKDGFYLADGMRDQVLFVRGEKVSRVAARPYLHYPMSVAVSPAGELFISDTRNNRVVKWVDGAPQVVADGLGRPRGIAFDARGNLYIADTFHNRVLRVELTPPAATAAHRDGDEGSGR